jgi:pyruvate kinase
VHYKWKFNHDSQLILIAGSDAILLGAETLRGLYPVETISTVGRICAEVKFLLCFLDRVAFSTITAILREFGVFFLALHLTCCHGFNYTCLSIVLQAEKVFNQDLYFKQTVKYVGEPMTHLESIASSAVRSIIYMLFRFESFFY